MGKEKEWQLTLLMVSNQGVPRLIKCIVIQKYTWMCGEEGKTGELCSGEMIEWLCQFLILLQSVYSLIRKEMALFSSFTCTCAATRNYTFCSSFIMWKRACANKERRRDGGNDVNTHIYIYIYAYVCILLYLRLCVNRDEKIGGRGRD